MFTHVVIGSNDIERSKYFYDAVLAVLGANKALPSQAPTGQARLFYRHEGNVLGITEPINGNPATVANGATLGFKCNSPEQVQQFHDTAIAHGGESIEAPPGVRHLDMGAMFLAYVRDPDGNKLCAVYRVPTAPLASPT